MNIARLEDRLVVVSEPVGVAVYDFNFELNFVCTHPHAFDDEELCVLRIGPISDYAKEYEEKLGWGLRLVNTPEEHLMASELEHWYPRISDLTPRTEIFDQLPSADVVEASFGWPIFLKGSRQTSRHNAALSVIDGPDAYEHAVAEYARDDILHWQKPVIREFVRLMPIEGNVAGKIRPSMEFRTFWWSGKCVGWGRYWYQVPSYSCPDIADGLELAGRAAEALQVPFIVIDIAKTADGRWIVIECNDAQESGYVAIPPQTIWRQVLDAIPSNLPPAAAPA